VARSKDRKLVFIPESLVKGLMEASSREGKPFSTFIEDVLKRVLKALEMGLTSEELTHFLEVFYTQKASGITLIPYEVLKYLEGKAEKDELKEKWYQCGEWYGKYLKEKFDKPVQAVEKLLKATRWELEETNVKEEGENVKFRCVSTTLTAEQTEFLINFIEGAMHALGYRKAKDDSTKGIILLEFTLCKA